MAIIDSLQKISDMVWELPSSYKAGMRVPARIIATEKLVREMEEAVYQQISNVATLPGIARYALCMPDGHSGYGFPIGGVAAMDVHEGGVISPGGIGFDINCGMRLITTNLTLEDVQPRLKEIVDRLFQRVPAGVGTHGFLKLSHNEFRDLVEQGARWCVERDLGWQEDLEFTEENGCIAGADASKISERAVERGLPAHRRQQRIRPLALDDGRDHLPGDGLDVRDVGHLRVGHDRRRVAVDEDDAVALFAQRLAGPRARIVELARLADDDGTGADDHDLLQVRPLRHRAGSSMVPWHDSRTRVGRRAKSR